MVIEEKAKQKLMNPKVDEFIDKQRNWQPELNALREIALSCMLNEEYKWGAPCYTYNGNNVLGLNGFKNHCSLWFFKGALLNDTYKILIKPGEDTQANRQLRYTSFDKILEDSDKIREYIFEAIEVEKANLKIEKRKPAELIIPVELQTLFDASEDLKNAFEQLTPGRKKEYVIHIENAKQEKTKLSRIEKIIPMILKGIGLNDHYKC